MVTDWWDMLQADVLPGDSAKIWRSADKVMKKCKKQAGENAPFISTAFSARDVMRIVDALGEGDKLRYFGMIIKAKDQRWSANRYPGAYSGTVLGSTLAAMFPERIDKMVLDSNSDPEEWHTSQASAPPWPLVCIKLTF